MPSMSKDAIVALLRQWRGEHNATGDELRSYALSIIGACADADDLDGIKSVLSAVAEVLSH